MVTNGSFSVARIPVTVDRKREADRIFPSMEGRRSPGTCARPYPGAIPGATPGARTDATPGDTPSDGLGDRFPDLHQRPRESLGSNQGVETR